MMRKGQTTFVDAIVLGLFITILLSLGFASGSQTASTQTASQEAFYANSMMLSTMMWENATYGSFANNENITIADAVDLYLATGVIGRTNIETAIGYVLNSTIKPGFDYIFFAKGNGRMLWVWNKQSDVCAKAITVISFGLTPTRTATEWTAPMLGIWPDWKQLPPKSACESIAG